MPTRSTTLPALALLVAALVPAVASAEHENDHRYHLEGYVLDADERPQSGVAVSAASSSRWPLGSKK